MIEGTVRCDDTTLQLFATDASLFEIRPAGVVWPKSTKDVVACVQYAAEKNLPIHPRGAGTGRSGGAIGPGLVLDFTQSMRRMIRVDDESVLVQPGAVRSRVNQMLRKINQRMIGPDPGFAPTSTIGSWIASNGAGTHWLKYGSPQHEILALEVVLANGKVLEITSEFENRPSQDPAYPIFQGVQEILASTSLGQPESISDAPDRAGYHLNGVLRPSDGINLVPLIAGSEGTLAIVTEAHLKTVAVPSHLGGALFLFDSLEKAARAIPVILPHRPNCCELLDRRRINMILEWDKKFQTFLPKAVEAVLFVEIDGKSSQEVNDRLNALFDELQVQEHLCFGAQPAYHQNEIEFFQDFLQKGELVLARMPEPFKAIALFEDVAVPIDRLPVFLLAVQNIFKRNEVFASFCGHVGQGHLKMNPIIDTKQQGTAALISRLAQEVYAEVIQHGGTISSDGTCALSCSQFLEQQHPNLYSRFEAIKALFDPGHLFNPGKVVTGDVETYFQPAFLRSSLGAGSSGQL